VQQAVAGRGAGGSLANFRDGWPTQARFWLEWGCSDLPNSVIPTGADHRKRGDLWSGGIWCRNVSRLRGKLTGGPLKPGVGLSGDVQISPTLSSRPEQITASAVICGVEGSGVVMSAGCEGSWRSSRNRRRETTKER